MTHDCVRADCLKWLRTLPKDSLDLVFGSPPYADQRLYLEDGKNLGIARKTDDWVAWMVEVFGAAQQACRGLVAFVVAGKTANFRWSAGPALLTADLHRAGFNLRNPCIYQRSSVPGSGGPDWLRSNYEWIVCTSPAGRLPWSDPCATGKPPKFAAGGEMSFRTLDGSRVNSKDKGRPCTVAQPNGTMERQRYRAPKLANPGNIIRCVVGGGRMGGDEFAAKNEAPFPEKLAEFFVLSFCPPGGLVCDPFAGSGTTGAVAKRYGRSFTGCDLRQSQVDLTLKRLAQETEQLFV